MIIVIYNEEIQFSDDLIKFVELKQKYSGIVTRTLYYVDESIDNKNINGIVEKVNTNYTNRCKEIIFEVSKYGIYDKTVEDFINGNPHFKEQENINNEIYFEDEYALAGTYRIKEITIEKSYKSNLIRIKIGAADNITVFQDENKEVESLMYSMVSYYKEHHL